MQVANHVGSTLKGKEMGRRYVLDGPPGSGKSTVLFGHSDGDGQSDGRPTIAGMGYACVHESVGEAHAEMTRRGLDFAGNEAQWLEIITELDREKYREAHASVTFFDRCFHHWTSLSRAADIPLPSWYAAENQSIRYDDPVFLVAPVRSMDLTDPAIHPSRRFTWEQRLTMAGALREMYRNLGYRVVDVPMFVEGDVDANNRRRIDCILKETGLAGSGVG